MDVSAMIAKSGSNYTLTGVSRKVIMNHELEAINSRLTNVAKRWCDDEDGKYIKFLGSQEENNLDYDEGIFIQAKIYHSSNFIEIRWRGLGIRRGVLYMDGVYCHPVDFSSEQDYFNNWLLGFTSAGNGTPAYMFPVNNKSSYDIAQQILVSAIV